MSLKRKTYERVMQTGFELKKQIVLKPGDKVVAVKVILYDPVNDLLGSRLEKLD